MEKLRLNKSVLTEAVKLIIVDTLFKEALLKDGFADCLDDDSKQLFNECVNDFVLQFINLPRFDTPQALFEYAAKQLKLSDLDKFKGRLLANGAIQDGATFSQDTGFVFEFVENGANVAKNDSQTYFFSTEKITKQMVNAVTISFLV